MLLTEWREQNSQAQQKGIGKKYIKLLKAIFVPVFRLSVVIPVAISNQCVCVTAQFLQMQPIQITLEIISQLKC